MTMEIVDVKRKVAEDVCSLLAGGLPYDEDQIHAEDWDSLADELAEIARHAAVGASRIAGYAGYARLRAIKSAL